MADRERAIIRDTDPARVSRMQDAGWIIVQVKDGVVLMERSIKNG